MSSAPPAPALPAPSPAPPAADVVARGRARSRWRAVAWVAGGWAAVGVFGVAQRWALAASGHSEPPDGAFMALTAVSMAIWAAMTPLVVALAARFPLERGVWRANLARHAGLALGFHVADVLLDLPVFPLLGAPLPPLGRQLLVESFINVFSYAALLGIAHAVAYQRELGERRTRAEALERQLAEARLLALEAQLHPHFLFNTLHAVAALVRVREDRAAIRMLVGLSDLLRMALRRRDAQTVPLAEELDFVRRYLDVEAIRFQDRLRAEVVQDAAVPGDAPVPHLVLQPLVENAIRHGVEARAAAGRVRVTAARAGGALVLRVEDDGPGPAAPARRAGRGIGLENTRARLAHLYAGAARLTLEPGAEGGAVATVVLPLEGG